MLTAKEARDLVKEAPDNEWLLSLVEEIIIDRAQKGYTTCIFRHGCCGVKEDQDVLIKQLNKFGYKASNGTSNCIHISWQG